jgi:ribosome-associated protein
MNSVEKAIVKAISDLKGENIKTYNVKGVNPLCDTIIVCTALNERNLFGIEDAVEEVANNSKIKINHIEGRNDSKWIIVDLNDVVIHIMTKEERERLDIDSIIKTR